MKKDDTSHDAESVAVFDLNMAGAYYACVFDAVIGDRDSRSETCSMRIGSRTYNLVCDKQGIGNKVPHCALVDDVDLSIARIVTRGGKIISHPGTAADGLREGQVKDPFGNSWVVCSC